MKSPINQLYHNITNAFENPNGCALAELKIAVDSGLLDAGINLLQDGVAPPAFIERPGGSETATICLHNPYLQTLWAFTYAWFVIYEQGVQKPLMNKTFDATINYNDLLVYRAGLLLSWTDAGNHEWPENLPSPIFFENEWEKSFVEKVNTIFIHSVAFLLHHEFAHAVLGHIDVSKSIKKDLEENQYRIGIDKQRFENYLDLKQLEKEADEFAFSALILQSDNEDHRRSKGWSVLAPFLCGLYRVQMLDDIFVTKHPFVHHRVEQMLNKLNFKCRGSQDYFTYLCGLVAKQTLKKFDPAAKCQTFDTAEEMLRVCLDEIDALLKTDAVHT